MIQYTHNCVLDLSVHEESSVLVGDQRPVLAAAGEQVGDAVAAPAAEVAGGPPLAGRQIVGPGDEGLAHGHRVGHGAAAAASLALHDAFQLLKIEKSWDEFSYKSRGISCEKFKKTSVRNQNETVPLSITSFRDSQKNAAHTYFLT